ncbi:MAG: AAA family ATPase [Patescibacteria group bacterium]|nr:AAA family ATPase [Patescibacteria group bacterium]
MTLKKIELTSFKSFGKKSTVLFSVPTVAIVGPNGSGKSNIVEAIKFVLGEQSMKSLRGKGSSDLIFKGSKTISQASKTSVTITFDNSDKIFSSEELQNVSLDFDEIKISREVSRDGSSSYKVNGTEVRLKDIVGLLASVNVGSSGHHIISQGEADRILNASLKDRRYMIEDALGLKIYQFRIKESERKLEKTLNNMKEVNSLRREVAPHLNFLKKQVEKIEKIKEIRDNLKNLYKDYLAKEFSYINFEEKKLNEKKTSLNNQILSLNQKIEKINSEKKEVKSEYANEIEQEEKELSNLRNSKDELSRKLGRIEGILEGLEKPVVKTIPESEWHSFVREIEKNINEALRKEDLESVIDILKGIKSYLKTFSPDNGGNKDNLEYQKMMEDKEALAGEVNNISEKEVNISNKINSLRQKESDLQAEQRDNEKVLYEFLGQKNTLNSELYSLNFKEEKLDLIKKSLEIEINEAKLLIGQEINSYLIEVNVGDISRPEQEAVHKKIERMKFKIEDAGAGDSSDVTKEYEETKEREEFLSQELEDLEKSVDSLKNLIEELRNTLNKEFKEGVEKINKQFQDFFVLMFGGGTAKLNISKEVKRRSKEEIEFEEEEKTEEGIDISVSLPKKKVKDLHMLSGGERSLVSIALLFAISQVNPPPFLVLDETDAALDEANSRKYGTMLENLSKYSQLILVTHNRETMSRVDVLYGVTMGGDGSSKLLSIKFENATTYAK